MSIQDEIGRMVKAARASTFAESRQLSLGDIADQCEAIAAKGYRSRYDGSEPEVVFDFVYARPSGVIGSWRGIYAELALGFSFEGDGMALSAFVEMLKSADGAIFQGYKGGDFRMSRSTPVWVANYGQSGNTAVVGVRDNGFQVVIETAWQEP